MRKRPQSIADVAAALVERAVTLKMTIAIGRGAAWEAKVRKAYDLLSPTWKETEVRRMIVEKLQDFADGLDGRYRMNSVDAAKWSQRRRRTEDEAVASLLELFTMILTDPNNAAGGDPKELSDKLVRDALIAFRQRRDAGAPTANERGGKWEAVARLLKAIGLPAEPSAIRVAVNPKKTTRR